MALKKASVATTKLLLGDEDWLEVRTDISKRERNKLGSYLPDRMVGESPEDEQKLTTGEALNLQTGLFAAIVVAWSADLPCTVEEYLSLEVEDTDRIDVALADHWRAIQPSEAEAKAAFRPSGVPLPRVQDGNAEEPLA